jgi:preprotein translocase subunit SecB
MKKASFAIVDYKFDEVSLSLKNRTSDDLQISFEPSGILNLTEKSYNLNFKTTITTSDDTSVFIAVNCSSRFTFKELTHEDDVPDFFYRNAIAILFPYVRAYISLLTTQANINGVILPTLNLIHLETTLKEHTEIVKL